MKKILCTIFFVCFAYMQMQAQKLLWEENFNDNARSWSIVEKETYTTKILNGLYIAEFTGSSGGRYFTQDVSIDPTRDYSIEMVVTLISSQEDYGFGLMWGYSDGSYNYGFNIAKSGYFKIYHSVDSTIVVKDWTKISVVKPTGTANHLKIEQKNKQLHFYVNDSHVYSMPAVKFHGASIGIDIGPLMKIAVDRITVHQDWPPINLLPDMANVVRVRMDDNINCPYTDKHPVLAPDGKTMFITREDHPENTGDITVDDIWFATSNGGNVWSKMKNPGAPLNDSKNNAVIAVTPDNNTLLIKGVYDPGKKFVKEGFSMIHKTSTGWGAPEEVKIKNYYNNHAKYQEAHLSSDRKTLIMAIERDDTNGERDLYVSFLLANGEWSEPKNMGKNLNTFADECSPFIAPDGKTLYYSTLGKSGYGSNDIFVSKRLDNTWTKWSEPQNMGPIINTADWDSYYTISASGEFAYLVSYTNNSTKEDIYYLKLPKSAKPDPVVLVYGKVLNAKTKAPLKAAISYENLDGGHELGQASSDPKTGDYKIILPYGFHYGFHAKTPGYISVNENMDLSQIHVYKEMKHDLYLVPIETGQTIKLNNVFFVQSKSELLPSSYPELDRLAQIMIDNPTIEIELGGHTDNIGDPAKNIKLSEDRVAVVKNYLVSKRINANRITGKGYGGSKPLGANDTEENRKLNRRVEFMITKK